MSQITVRADSRLEAILKVKAEVGPDAAIVAEKRVPAAGIAGRLGKTMYEVVVQMPIKPEPAPAEPPLDVDGMRNELDELREMIQTIQGKGAVVMAPSAPDQARRSWQALGIDPEDVGRYADKAPSREALTSMLLTGVEITDGRHSFVGPPGVGKTTTIAKLAARLKGAGSVGILCLDSHRIGAMESMRSYAKVLDVRFEEASTPDDATMRIRAMGDCQAVLIDTPAIQPGEGVRFEEMRLALEQADCICNLVLSAAAKPKDNLRAIELAASLNPRNLIFTQMDLTTDFGGLLVVGARHGFPISYVSDGPRIPGDIHQPSTDELVDMILR